MEGLKIYIDSKKLLKAIKVTERGKDKKVANALYGCLLLRVSSDGFLHLITSNGLTKVISNSLRVVMTGFPKTEKDIESKKVVVRQYYIDCTTLKKLLSLLIGELELTFLHSQIRIKLGAGLFYIPFINTPDTIDRCAQDKNVLHSLSLEIPDFRKWLNFTSECMADEYLLRPQLTGVMLDVKENSMAMVATNGRLLAKMEINSVKPKFQGQFIIPADNIKILQSLMPKEGMLDIDFYEKSALIHIDSSLSLWTSLIDGKYPNYNAVIPNHTTDITITRCNFLRAVRRVGLFSDISDKIKLRMEGNEMLLSACDRDIDLSASEVVHIQADELPNNEKVFTIGFNAEYLAMILNKLRTDNVKMGIVDSGRCVIFKETEEHDDKIVYILMPMYIDDNE